MKTCDQQNANFTSAELKHCIKVEYIAYLYIWQVLYTKLCFLKTMQDVTSYYNRRSVRRNLRAQSLVAADLFIFFLYLYTPMTVMFRGGPSCLYFFHASCLIICFCTKSPPNQIFKFSREIQHLLPVIISDPSIGQRPPFKFGVVCNSQLLQFLLQLKNKNICHQRDAQ